VEGAKPLHTFRKEAGSIIATKAGIHAASRFLRHSDIQVTSMHYADYKERVTVDMVPCFSRKMSRTFQTPSVIESTNRPAKRALRSSES
jgi:hypothetical protein